MTFEMKTLETRGWLSAGVLRAGILVALMSGGASLGMGASIWNNGAINSNTPRYCDSSPLQCGGNTNTDNGFETYDNFAIGTSVTVGGFTFNDDLQNATQSDYVQTKWSIWSSDPETASGPIVSGVATATLSAGALGSELFSVTGLNVSLSAGTYWLGTQNVWSGSSDISYRYFANGNGLTGFEQSSTGIATQFGSLPPYSVSGDTAFTIEAPSGAPEPMSLLLMVGPAAFIGWRRMRRAA